MENDNRVATPRTQKTFKQRLMSLAVKPTLRYIDRDPEKNVPKLLDWIIKLDKTGKYATTQSLAIKLRCRIKLQQLECSSKRTCGMMWIAVLLRKYLYLCH